MDRVHDVPEPDLRREARLPMLRRAGPSAALVIEKLNTSNCASASIPDSSA